MFRTLSLSTVYPYQPWLRATAEVLLIAVTRVISDTAVLYTGTRCQVPSTFEVRGSTGIAGASWSGVQYTTAVDCSSFVHKLSI